MTVIDGAGRTVLPGLIDAHAHYTFDPTEGALEVLARRSDAEILCCAPRAMPRSPCGRRSPRRAAPGSIRNLEMRAARRHRRGRRPWPAPPRGRHGGRHHGRPRLSVRARGGRPGSVRDGHPARRPRRRGRRQGRGLRGRHADDDRPAAGPHGPRRAGADRRRAARHRRDRRGAARPGHEPCPGQRVGAVLGGGRGRQRGACLAGGRSRHRGRRGVGRVARADPRRDRRQPDAARADRRPAGAPGSHRADAPRLDRGGRSASASRWPPAPTRARSA